MGGGGAGPPEAGRTAFLRGLDPAVGSGLLLALTVNATTDEVKPVIVAGGTAALVALGFRGLGEGAYDADRNAQGKVSAGDVGQG